MHGVLPEGGIGGETLALDPMQQEIWRGAQAPAFDTETSAIYNSYY